MKKCSCSHFANEPHGGCPIHGRFSERRGPGYHVPWHKVESYMRKYWVPVWTPKKIVLP